MKAKSQSILWQRMVITFLTLGLGYLLLLSSCSRAKKEAENKELSDAATKSLQEAVADRDATIEDLLTSFDKIDANLEIIREKEGILHSYAEGEEVIGNREERIVHDIQVINTLMADNRDEIANLREKLGKAGVNMKSLETRLNHMEMANVEKTAQMEDLKLKLANAETSLQGLNDTLNRHEMRIAMQYEVINSQSAVIQQQDGEMHEAYIATGSYKELKERGLVDKKGALFGVIGGEKEFTANTNPEEFVQIDQREQVNIPIYSSKKVEFITPHPQGSYVLEKGLDGKYHSIEITRPDDFWQTSRYLIVATE